MKHYSFEDNGCPCKGCAELYGPPDVREARAKRAKYEANIRQYVNVVQATPRTVIIGDMFAMYDLGDADEWYAAEVARQRKNAPA